MTAQRASRTDATDSLVFAEKFIALVAEGDHNSTYKVATAVALLQAAQESEGDEISSRRVAELVIELFWRHSSGEDGVRLRQMNRADQASAIETELLSLRGSPRATRAMPPIGTPEYERSLRSIETTLLAWPLRLLQRADDQFIYKVPEPSRRSRAAFGGSYSGQLSLKPGVGLLLRRIAPLARQVLEVEWVQRVARYNAIDLDETRLRRRMFGYSRQSWPAWLRPALEELQEGCFYCGGPLPRRTAGDGNPSDGATHIDHFIPWVISMNDAVENLVVADSVCNLRKSDHPPAPVLVMRWLDHMTIHSSQLHAAAVNGNWPSNPNRTLTIARSYYDRFPEGAKVLGWSPSGLEPADMSSAAYALAAVR